MVEPEKPATFMLLDRRAHCEFCIGSLHTRPTQPAMGIEVSCLRVLPVGRELFQIAKERAWQ
jgi:hypothetical protein